MTDASVTYREAREKIKSGDTVEVFYPGDSDRPTTRYHSEDGELVVDHKIGKQERGISALRSFEREAKKTATFVIGDSDV